MSWILDLLTVAVIGVTVFLAVKNGFVKTIISASSFVICIIVTLIFMSPLSQAIQQTDIAESIKQKTQENIAEYISEENLSGVNDLIEGASESFNSLLALTGIGGDELESWYSENKSGTEESVTERLAEKISAPIIKIVSTGIAIIILYLGTKLILVIISFILGQFTKLPVLHSCDKLLGVILGVVLAVIKVCLIGSVLKLILDNSLFLSSDFLRSLDPSNTLIFRLFYDFDIFSFFKSLIK